jgi:hypothetical protein
MAVGAGSAGVAVVAVAAGGGEIEGHKLTLLLWDEQLTSNHPREGKSLRFYTDSLHSFV